MVQNMNEEGMNITEVCQRSKEGVEMCRLLILNSQILLVNRPFFLETLPKRSHRFGLQEALPEGRPFFVAIGHAPAFYPTILDNIQSCGTPLHFQRGDKLITQGDTTDVAYM